MTYNVEHSVGEKVIFLYPLGTVDPYHPKGLSIGEVLSVRIVDDGKYGRTVTEFVIGVGSYKFTVGSEDVVAKYPSDRLLPSLSTVLFDEIERVS